MLTKKQYKILRYILKHQRLSLTLEKFNLDYLDLQMFLPYDALTFSDNKFDKNTKVNLSTIAEANIEEYRRENYHLILALITAVSTALAVIVTLILAA